MPGGPKRLEEREYEPLPRAHRVLSLSEDEKRWDAAMVVWRRARQFQKEAKQVAQSSGISFARFQVLDVAERLTRQKSEPVSELEVARGAQLAKSTVSELMAALMQQGLVDIGPDAWGVSYRIGVTDKGERLVAKLRRELLDIAGVLLSSALPKGGDDFGVNRGQGELVDLLPCK
jgi:DNA-binding MarR family transcriptional regulator